jgi:DNA-binding transcriptional LysR family regulator
MTCKQSLKVALETLANLESFVRSAEAGNFSAAARRLALTPAAVSRNVATLERNLGVRLFQRTTRMRNAARAEFTVRFQETIILDDPEATCRAALLGLGVTLLAVPHALPHLERGALVRLVPQWYADGGPISIYYASRTLLPAKTRVFVDFVVESFRRDRLAERFAGSLG